MAENSSGRAPGADKKSRFGRAGSGIWKFLCSVRLTLFILFTAAAASIAGTVIEQNQPDQTYLINYGERWAGVIKAIGLDNMYNSWWFTAILLFLVVNIIACTFERFPPKWKTLFRKETSFNPSIIEKLSTRDKFRLDLDRQGARERALEVLKKKRYGVVIDSPGEGAASLHAVKGKMGRLGSDVVHISLLTILLGSVIGSYWGYRDFRAIILGTTVSVPGMDFGLRLDKFWIDYYDTGQIRQYNSVVTVVEGGKDVLEKQIWVNEPLYYKGVRFYQSSYGTAWNMIKEAEFELLENGARGGGPPVRVGWGERRDIPGSGYSVRLVGYVSDFAFDESTKEVFSKSGEVDNPAVLVEVHRDGTLVSRPWIFYKYPGLIPTIPGTPYELTLAGFRNVPYSGIAVTKDPGTNVVWVGAVLMGVGFYLAFFVFHKRLWLVIKDAEGGGVSIEMGGMTNKNPLGFEREFKEIAGAIGRGHTEAVSEDKV